MSQLRQLLDIEEQAQLWDVEFAGLHPWAAIRTTVLSTQLYRSFGHTQPHASRRRLGPLVKPAKWPGYLRFLRLIARPSNHQFTTVIFKDVMTRTGDVDRIYTAYYETLPSALVLETNFTGQTPPLGIDGNATVYTEDIMQAWVRLRSRFNRAEQPHARLVVEFAEHIAALFDMPDLQADLADRINSALGMYEPLMAFIIRHIQPRLQSKTIFSHLASYSNRYGLLTRVMHDLGYTVIEPQHGTIHSEHFAYQFPPSCFEADHPSKHYLPDILLTFGDFWEQVATVPYDCVTIGYPYLDEVSSSLRQQVTKSDNQILMISQGIVTAQMVEIAQRVATVYPEKTIIFKLHPQEVQFTERYAALTAISNVRVVGQGDVYRLIAESPVIVGYSSTVLYEALAFGRKRLFILDNDALEGAIGTRFQETDTLLAIINDPAAGYSDVDPDHLWATNSRQRLRTFLAEQPL
jgi:hypothetical protein